jgi:hypothetical protein
MVASFALTYASHFIIVCGGQERLLPLFGKKKPSRNPQEMSNQNKSDEGKCFRNRQVWHLN